MALPYKYGKNPERIFRTMRDPYSDFPWTGNNNMGITSSCASFNPAFKVYSLPLFDASRPITYKMDSFDDYVSDFQQTFKIGDTVNALKVDRTDKDNVSIYGKIAEYKIDYENKRIRVFVRSEKDMTIHEVYAETLFSQDGLYESTKKQLNDKFKMILG